MNISEIVNEIIEYTKNSDLYEYKDCYNNDEEAYDDFYNVLKKSPNGILTELGTDISRLAIEDDLRDKDTKKQFDLACNIILKINIFNKENNKLFDNVI